MSVGGVVDVESGERVCLGVGFTRSMSEAELESGEVEGPAGVAAAEVLCGAPIFEIGVVGDDFEGLGKSFEEVAPVFEGFDDGEHFSVVDLVVAFGGLHGGGAESDWMPKTIFLLLKQCASGSKAGGIYFDASGSIWVPKR